MTNEAIRIACAEECGFRKLTRPRAFVLMWAPGHISRREGDWEDPRGNVMSQDCLPDYPVDANAALTLVALLAKDGWTIILECYCETWKCRMYHVDQALHHTGHTTFNDTFAGAVSECFLRVRGRWQEQRLF